MRRPCFLLRASGLVLAVFFDTNLTSTYLVHTIKNIGVDQLVLYLLQPEHPDITQVLHKLACLRIMT